MLRLLFVAAVLAACQPAYGTIVNGDFETGDFSGWSLAESGAHAFVRPAGSGYEAVLTFSKDDPPSEYYADLRQIFTVTEPSVFSVDYRGDWDGADLGAFIWVVDSRVFDGEGGSAYATVYENYTSYPEPGPTQYGPATLTAVLQPGTYGVEIHLVRQFPQVAGIAAGSLIVDNVSVVPIPEPSSGMLAASGAAALAVYRRRQDSISRTESRRQ